MDSASCQDSDIGSMLPAYEFGLLPPDDQARFESHVANCPFCRSRLHQMSPFVTAVQTEPGSMSPGVTGLPNQKSFERSVLSGAFTASPDGAEQGRVTLEKIWKTYAPLTVIVLVALMLIVMKGRTSGAADLARLSQPEAGYIESIAASSIGRTDLIRGLELLFANQPLAALAAVPKLKASLPSSDPEVRGCARWYLAQIYLTEGEIDTATMHLKALSETPTKFQQLAVDQLRELRRERLIDR